MNESKQYCTFCGSFSFHYITAKKKKGKILCFGCIDTAMNLKQKLLLVEKQLVLPVAWKSYGKD